MEKLAGTLVYLMEELTDARLRCDQLKNYVSKATSLVEKSKQKSHLYEVAGPLISAIPETLLKLDKALDATALAASRMDYEELKQGLRPEKVQELEKVLQGARIRQVNRQGEDMSSKVAVSSMVENEWYEQSISGHNWYFLALKRQGNGGYAGVMYKAEGKKVVKTSVTKADMQLWKKAQDVPGEIMDKVKSKTASQVKIATASDVVSVLLHVASRIEKDAEAGRDVSRAKVLASLEEIMSAMNPEARFEEGKPADPTENMSKEDAERWKDNTEEYGNKFKKEADFETPDPLDSHPIDPVEDLEGIKIRAIQALKWGEAGKLKSAIGEVANLTNAIGSMCNGIGGNAGAQAFSLAYKLSQALRTMMHDTPTLAKFARFESGKPADPTENMNEDDAAKWKEMNEEHRDNFKAAAQDEDEGDKEKKEEKKPEWLQNLQKKEAAGNSSLSGKPAKAFYKGLNDQVTNAANLVGKGVKMAPKVSSFLDYLQTDEGKAQFPKVNQKWVLQGVNHMKDWSHKAADSLSAMKKFAQLVKKSEAKTAADGDFTWDADKAKKMLTDMVDNLLDSRSAREGNIRSVGYVLQDLLEDAMGQYNVEGRAFYQDAQVRALRDKLYALDGSVGSLYRELEDIAKQL